MNDAWSRVWLIAGATLVCLSCARARLTAASAETTVDFARGSTAYVVAAPKSALERRTVERLTGYLEKVLGKPARLVGSLAAVPAGRPAITLVGHGVRPPIPVSVPRQSDESFALTTGSTKGRLLVVAAGKTDKGLKRAVQRLIIESRQEPRALVIPPLRLSESPWIPHREWTVCPWTPSFVRGVFDNPYADKRLDIYLYGDKRLSDYVEMFDWFGFSGCQLMETCYTYRVMGSVESTQDWQRKMARFLRENGQEVSLWVWAALFNGFGWNDSDVVYQPREGESAFEDPAVRRGFEKYYDHYAELAPYVDRFFGHFYDPGRLQERSDVLSYMRLLRAKLRAKNPNIIVGVDCWAAEPGFLLEMARSGFKDGLFLESGVPGAASADERTALHAEAKKLGLKLGVWGWYLTEYETDQMASMYVNSQFLKNYYNEWKNTALKALPVEYWSEMEAHHLNDIYSMYVSGQLLWNPERDPRQILQELATGIWGPANGPKVLKALELIEDCRTGPTWGTYWWTDGAYRVGTEDPAGDLKRADNALAELGGMKTDKAFVPKFPLPYPPEVFVDVMIPHLKQTKLFAEFRIKVADIRRAADGGASKEALEEMLADAWRPVPEYDTWIGTFGTKEVRQQKKVVDDLCKKYGLSVKDPEWFRSLETDRMVQRLRNYQREHKGPFVFSASRATDEFFWQLPYRTNRFQKALDDGLILEVGEDQYQLANWECWAAR